MDLQRLCKIVADKKYSGIEKETGFHPNLSDQNRQQKTSLDF